MDEIYRCGRFVFRHDDERLSGYRSAHLRNINLERKRAAKAKQETESELTEPGKV